jgi:hypothetical protein
MAMVMVITRAKVTVAAKAKDPATERRQHHQILDIIIIMTQQQLLLLTPNLAMLTTVNPHR